jgi:hypothetical protein
VRAGGARLICAAAIATGGCGRVEAVAAAATTATGNEQS